MSTTQKGIVFKQDISQRVMHVEVDTFTAYINSLPQNNYKNIVFVFDELMLLSPRRKFAEINPTSIPHPHEPFAFNFVLNNKSERFLVVTMEKLKEELHGLVGWIKYEFQYAKTDFNNRSFARLTRRDVRPYNRIDLISKTTIA